MTIAERPSGAQVSKSGENSVLQFIYARYFDRLTRSLGRQVRDITTGADLAQSAFIKLVERGVPKTEDEAQALVHTIGRNLATDHLRGATRKREILDESEDLILNYGDERPTPEDEAIARETLKRLVQIIPTLPARRREALFLVRFKNLSYEEAAAEMNITDKTVRRLVYLALQDCRIALTDAELLTREAESNTPANNKHIRINGLNGHDR